MRNVRDEMTKRDRVPESIYSWAAFSRVRWLARFGAQHLGALHGKYNYPGEGDFVTKLIPKQ